MSGDQEERYQGVIHHSINGGPSSVRVYGPTQREEFRRSFGILGSYQGTGMLNIKSLWVDGLLPRSELLEKIVEGDGNE